MIKIIVRGETPIKYKAGSGVVPYVYLRQNGSVKKNYSEEGALAFFDGEMPGEPHSNSIGSFFRNMQKNRAARVKARTDAKKAQSKAQSDTADAMAKGVEGDKALAGALAANAPKEEPPVSHTGLYIGIGAGVLVLGAIAYYVVKHKKGK